MTVSAPAPADASACLCICKTKVRLESGSESVHELNLLAFVALPLSNAAPADFVSISNFASPGGIPISAAALPLSLRI